MLLAFLKNQEDVLERLEQLRVVDKEKPDRSDRYGRKIGSTRTTKKEEVCGVCGEGGHSNKIYFCRKLKKLTLPEKRTAMDNVGACSKCLVCHEHNAGD